MLFDATQAKRRQGPQGSFDLPLLIALVGLACVGLVMMTASTPGCFTLSRMSFVQCGIFHFVANASVDSRCPPVRLTTSMPGMLKLTPRL